MKKIVTVALTLLGILGSCALLSAQQAAATPTVSDHDIQLMRKDLRSEKKQIVAANMSLTDAEAQKFWLVYDEYAGEITKINDVKLSIIKEYAANYESLTDSQAQSLTRRWTAADESAVQLRMTYLPSFQKVLPGKKVARFFQIDRRIAVLTDLQASFEIPLVEP